MSSPGRVVCRANGCGDPIHLKSPVRHDDIPDRSRGRDRAMDAVGMTRTFPPGGRDAEPRPVDALPPDSPRTRAALHTAAAERLAQQHQWQQAYMHLQAAVELLRGGDTTTGTHDE